jgi:hypothetical protein
MTGRGIVFCWPTTGLCGIGPASNAPHRSGACERCVSTPFSQHPTWTAYPLRNDVSAKTLRCWSVVRGPAVALHHPPGKAHRWARDQRWALSRRPSRELNSLSCLSHQSPRIKIGVALQPQLSLGTASRLQASALSWHIMTPETWLLRISMLGPLL